MFITNNTKAVKENDDTVAKHTQNTQIELLCRQMHARNSLLPPIGDPGTFTWAQRFYRKTELLCAKKVDR